MTRSITETVALFCLFALLFAAAISGGQAVAGDPSAPGAPAEPVKRVLIVTGEDYPGHLWRQTTPVLVAHLKKDPRLQVTTLEDLKALAAVDLGKYDVVVVAFKNYDPAVPGPEAQQHLDRFVRNGGGMVLVHFACGAFQEWPDFVKLAGRVWNPKMRAHDPYGKFRVEFTKEEHPITRGMKDFETSDELYTCLDGQPSITVLATAMSKGDNKAYPMAFVLEYDKGRVFHTPLGHDVKALSTPGVGELLRRGTAWTAGLNPTATP